MSRRLILYIAMSLDGFIAKKDDNIDFLSIVETPNEDFGYSDLLQNIDTVIWGRKTFDKVLSFGNGVPHRDKKVYVISNTRHGNVDHAEYVDNIIDLITSLKQQNGKDIYCDGGAEIVYELLKHRLFDRIIISIIPHLIGEGIRLFKDNPNEQELKFLKSINYPSGLVQLWYDVKNKNQ
ncbi:MAG TPA: dihydrofolate reductase family protein [Anditalea sp.]|nr:dihydrofolate reductase family protein [Anditalea sp.]